jgi:hypothetical protein
MLMIAFLAALLALIWRERSRDLVQVGYRCMQILTSLGCSRYANSKDPRGRTSSLAAECLVEL